MNDYKIVAPSATPPAALDHRSSERRKQPLHRLEEPGGEALGQEAAVPREVRHLLAPGQKVLFPTVQQNSLRSALRRLRKPSARNHRDILNNTKHHNFRLIWKSGVHMQSSIRGKNECAELCFNGGIYFLNSEPIFDH